MKIARRVSEDSQKNRCVTDNQDFLLNFSLKNWNIQWSHPQAWCNNGEEFKAIVKNT
jgi:hypothetical protein